jgi:histone H3/H4
MAKVSKAAVVKAIKDIAEALNVEIDAKGALNKIVGNLTEAVNEHLTGEETLTDATWDVLQNLELVAPPEEAQEPAKAPKEKAAKAPKKPKEPKAPRYNRISALMDACANKTARKSVEALTEKANELYAKKGGKDNAKEAAYYTKRILPALVHFGIVTQDGDKLSDWTDA